MKSFVILLLVFLGMNFPMKEEARMLFFHPQEAEARNAKEFLLEYYQQTHEQLLAEVSGLSKEQLHFKASPDTWSISQNLEHIILTENALFEMVQEMLEQPASPEKRGAVTATDEELIAQITDRSFKAQASENLQPEGTYDNPEEAMAEFEAQRERILNYIQSAQVDFRDYVSESPFGYVDAYQNFLFLAGHTSRHTLQIEEVKGSSGFPGKR